MLKEQISQVISAAYKELYGEEITPHIEIPANPEHGDFATNIAMTGAKKAGKSPREVAEELKKKITHPLIAEKSIAGPGFINIKLSQESYMEEVNEIITKGDAYADSEVGAGKKINLEFISANPTGPLTILGVRHAFPGMLLSKCLESQGYEVDRRFYLNDAGNQIKILGESVATALCNQQGQDREFQENYYQGEYIKDIAKEFGKDADATEEFDILSEKAGKYALDILVEEIKSTLESVGTEITFDSEKDLHESGAVEDVFKWLQEKEYTEEKDGAVWAKTMDFGDDQNWVLKRKDKGAFTYYAADIAYLKTKFDQGIEKAIVFFGADHHAYTSHIKIAARMLGYEGKLDTVVNQMVRLIKDGEEYKMSKRAGNFVLVDDLLEEVPLDVMKYFFLDKSFTTHLDFDLNKAKDTSENNPVYYIQYAHARMTSILEKAQAFEDDGQIDSTQLSKECTDANEVALIKHLTTLEDAIQGVTEYEFQKTAHFALEAARKFHKFYATCKVIDPENSAVSMRRIRITEATQIVLKKALYLMGISAPDKM